MVVLRAVAAELLRLAAALRLVAMALRERAGAEEAAEVAAAAARSLPLCSIG